ncbi:MAG TPA: xanthine dehydrogenase family protein subunit M [Polyangiaceae bacterium]
MRPFQYLRPADERAALAAASVEGAALLGGGTCLVDLMKLDVMAPASVVDVTALPYGAVEDTPGGGVRIGALVRNSDLAYHAAIRERYPLLSEALLAGASPQLRNMATVGGNLMQRTRCSYFRDAGVGACNKRHPSSGCAALEGHHRMHAVLGTSLSCIAVHPSDMCVAMTALDAVIHVRGPSGERDIPIVDFHRLPGDRPDLETELGRGEIITHVTLPASPFAAHSRYVKVRDRASYAFALASAAVGLELAGDTIRSARVALGGVGTKPWRSREAEGALVGRAADVTNYRAAAQAALAGAVSRPGNAFKVTLAQRTLVRALELASGRST